MQKALRTLTLSVFTACVVMMQAGCAFHLRSSHHVPETLRTLKFSSYQQYSELARLVQRELRYHDIVINPPDTEEISSIRIEGDRLESSTLSTYQSGLVAEYELTYEVYYTLRLPKQDPLRLNINIRRQYTDDINTSLAKSREMKTIASEMRKQAASKILQQMIMRTNKVLSKS